MAYIYKGCEECGRNVDIDDQTCSKCGFDFTVNPRISPKCPYCEEELHLHDFYVMEVDKKSRKRVRGFLGESMGGYNKMYHCPFCGKILGFTNAAYVT